MPALRGVSAMAPRTRRRSSVFAPAKAGVYAPPSSSSHHNHSTHSGLTSSHLSHLPPRPISFAPNVTPVSFTASSSDDEGGADLSDSNTPPLSPGAGAQAKLFPPSSSPAPPPQRKRCPPGKRRSQGYIPRPPNAFMLFRADFVRQKHVPGSIETNHGSLSKIIGNCWRSLPLDEKKVWETKAKHEKAAHKIAYPHYRFKPVHNKSKKKAEVAGTANPSSTQTKGTGKKPGAEMFEEEMRCEEVTQLLLQGLKGEELTQALRELEKRRQVQPPSALPLGLEHQAQHLYGGEPGVYGQDTLAYEGAYAAQDPYVQQDGSVYGAQQEPFGAGSYVDYSRGATPSTASSIPFTAMSAPQPTYPASSLFGLGTSNGGGGGGGGGQQQQQMFMQRRPSSVPAIPTNFGMGWGADFVMQDDSGVPSYAGFHQQQQPSSSATSANEQQGNGIEIPSVPFLPPPSSAGPVPMISGFLSSSTSDVYGHRMSLSQRMALGHRRSSSAGAAFGGMRGQGWGVGMWGGGMSGMGEGGGGMGMGLGGEGGMGGGGQEEGAFSWPPPQEIQRDDSELPEADLSLFNPSFLSTGALGVGQQDVAPTAIPVEQQHQHQHQGGGGVMGGQEHGQGQQQTPSPQHPFTTSELYQHLPPQHQHQHQQHQGGMELGPLDSIAPNVSVHGHSAHSSVDLNHVQVQQNALQFQPGLDTQVQVQMPMGQGQQGGMGQGGGQQGLREPSPVEQYEQMYLAEQGQYGVFPGGEYDMAAYGVQYQGVSV